MLSRREFVKLFLIAQGLLLKSKYFATDLFAATPQSPVDSGPGGILKRTNPGTEESKGSLVYKVQGGSPEENIDRLLALIGGIETVIGKNDIVVIKPNAQWTGQGMTNTDAMKAFMRAVLQSPGFQGEIIVAENHQYKAFNSRGWTTENRNGAFNYNELIDYFNTLGFENVTKYHWRAAGPNPNPLEGDDAGDGRPVKGPAEGDGYVWRDDIVYTSPHGKRCWMTYPIFTSSYSGVTIDLKNGAWKDGRYLKERPVKFINFSALNHHSYYCGVTASIKNLMGVVDMSCGFQAPTPEHIYNVHFIGINKHILKHVGRVPYRRMRRALEKYAHKDFHFTGGALGKFMHDIRYPDLNIITAHHVGWGSRWDLKKSSYPKALLAGKDPVALDFIAAKYILLKETPVHEKELLSLNDPDNTQGPFYKFLLHCHKENIGNVSEKNMKIIS